MRFVEQKMIGAGYNTGSIATLRGRSGEEGLAQKPTGQQWWRDMIGKVVNLVQSRTGVVLQGKKEAGRTSALNPFLQKGK